MLTSMTARRPPSLRFERITSPPHCRVSSRAIGRPRPVPLGAAPPGAAAAEALEDRLLLARLEARALVEDLDPAGGRPAIATVEPARRVAQRVLDQRVERAVEVRAAHQPIGWPSALGASLELDAALLGRCARQRSAARRGRLAEVDAARRAARARRRG